jgi:tetratricopeptide (TPR) repeat protein
LQQRHSFVVLLRAKEAAVLFYALRFLIALSLLLLALLGSFADTTEPKPTPKQITEWIEQLGDNDFKVREDASKKLWQAGAAAESALEKALQSNDREVIRRARELLSKFRWGIYPDTPADIVALVHAYQSSAGNARKEVLEKLLDSGDAGFRAILKIATAEKDASQRKMLGDLVSSKLPSAFSLAVTEGKDAQIEHLLELGHAGKFIDLNQYAAYWLLRGRLPERIAHFRARLNEHPDDTWLAQTLAYLHRNNGDLAAARKAAEKSGLADLLEGILYEMGDWKALAERPNFVGARIPAERWAYRAAFARLAGKHNEFDNAVSELQKFAEKTGHDASSAFVAAKGLLLNDRPAEGIELLRALPGGGDFLFDILCARLDFAAAMDLAVKKSPGLDLARARQLCLLAEKEGEVLFDRYAERIKDEVDADFVESLLKEELRAGLKDRAFAHAAKAMAVAPPKGRRGVRFNQAALQAQYFAQLFPRQSTTAEFWWGLLRQQFQDESPEAAMKRLRELLEGKAAAKDVEAWIEHAESRDSGSATSGAPLAQKRQALAEAAIFAGLDDRATSLLEKADSRDALIRLGDLLAAKKQWSKAAQRYREAWGKELRQGQERAEGMRVRAPIGREPYDPLPLYLAGDALVRAGQDKEGKKLIEQAHAIPFADFRRRYSFINALTQRGHKEAAQREAKLMLAVSEPNTLYSNDAFHRLGFAALARKDYLTAAEDYEKSMLLCCSSGTHFISTNAYVFVPAQIHRLRASALIAAGKIDEALRHADLALALAPGYIELPIALIPELERRGRKKEATDLFNRCYETWEKVVRAYPRYAQAHNSLAWLSACCRRNLDAALQHAEKAVELAPTHAGYLDTLAEVHFQRGNKDKAVELQKRAIELNPKRVYFRKQLKRLQAGDPSAERPPENDEE